MSREEDTKRAPQPEEKAERAPAGQEEKATAAAANETGEAGGAEAARGASEAGGASEADGASETGGARQAGGTDAGEVTEKLARERDGKPGAGARGTTASQVDDPETDKTPRPQTASPRQEAKAPARGRAAGAPRVGAGKQAEEKPEKPSPKQPWLDRLVGRLKERFGEGVVEEASINRLSQDRPTLVVNKEHWLEVARFLKEDPELSFVYLSDIVGVDYVQYMEVVYHLVSIAHREHLTVKVRTDREEPSVPSVVSVWAGANWQEREAYDLLGIRFAGHPDLRRIMLPEDWVGHPLRKDYEPYDIEI